MSTSPLYELINERGAWKKYKAYCLSWRRTRNYPTQEVFLGDDHSRGLFELFRFHRDQLFKVSRPKWRHG